MEIMIEKSKAKDIIPIFYGHEVCRKNYKYGPNTRDYYLLHFCLKGKGELFDKFGRHVVTQGELFIIRPGEITTYCADNEEPWEYSWIAFEGDFADIFDTESSVYPFPTEIGLLLRELLNDKVSDPSIFISLIYKLVYHLFSEKRQNEEIGEKIKQYINFNYMNELTVKNISDYFGFERSYLYRIFKRHVGIGIKEYITKIRLERSRILLEKGYSVGNTANAVGYKEQSNFSKAFAKHFGISPKEIQNNK